MSRFASVRSAGLLSVLLLGVGASAQAPPKVMLLTDNPNSGLVRSFRALYPAAVQIYNIAILKPEQPALTNYPFLVTEIQTPANLAKLNLDLVREFAASGRSAILGLDEFAALYGLQVGQTSLTNVQHLAPLAPEQRDALVKAAAALCGNVSAGKPRMPPAGRLPEPWMNAMVSNLEAEVLEDIPRIRIMAVDPLTTGFAPGDELPWCGQQRGQYVQRQIRGIPAAKKDKIKILAVSTVNRQPVFVKAAEGKGWVYGLDFRSLDEPQVTWETRGSFNKYVFPGNLIGGTLRLGHYWNRKPLAEEWGGILRKVAAEHPPLRVEVEGFQNGYNVYSLNLGDPAKPVWVAFGMYHADDEWRSALGLVDFASYLADHRNDPAIRERLEKFCVKVIPCQTPGMYMKSLRGDAPGPEQPLPKPADTNALDVALHFSIHECDGALQFGVGPMTGASIPQLARVEALHRGSLRDRLLEWDGLYPQQADMQSWRVGNGSAADAESVRFYGLPGGFEHLDRFTKTSLAKTPYGLYIESARRGFLPEDFLQNYQLRCLIWPEDLYRSAVLNEMVADWVLSAFLTCP